MDKIILGIESSCDETACSIVKNGRIVISNIISSQIDIHRKFGGVVPEIASRNHTLAIENVVREALTEASMTMDRCHWGHIRTWFVRCTFSWSFLR